MRFATLFSVAVIALLLTTINTTQASILAKYHAFDYTGGIHGLWTNSSPGLTDPANAFSRYWSIDAILTVIDDDSGVMDGIADYATLVGTATNENGVDTAQINLIFSGFIGSDYASNGIAPKGTNHGDEDTWDYYTSVEGTILFSYNSQLIGINEMESNPDRAFQMGLGANDKNSEFGASSWVESSAPLPLLPGNPAHWDLNLRLENIPEPMSFMVWAGIAVCCVSRSRRRAY